MSLLRKPTTDRIANANRANAEKSTGPRTAAGLATASRNAVRHGVLAETLPPGLTELHEDPSAFARLRDALQAAFDSHDEFERLLVADLAGIRWRLMRIRRAEALLQARQTRVAKTTQQLQGSPLLLQAEALDRLIRYEAHLERQFERKVQQFVVWRRTMSEPLVVSLALQDDQLTPRSESQEGQSGGVH